MGILYIILGFEVGCIVGLTGVGGGSLMSPLLVLLFGVSPATAVGTDLLYAAITKAGGSFLYARRQGIDWRLCRLLATGSIPASAVTIFFLGKLKSSPSYSGLISHSLGFALVLTAISLLARPLIVRWRGEIETSRFSAPIAITVGVLMGVLVSLSSVGAGAIGIAALFLIAPGLSTSKTVGTDIAHAVPLTLVAGLGHWALGGVDFQLLGYLLTGSLPGIYLGSQLSTLVPERVLRGLLAVMLVLVGSRMIAH